jgi:mevalonate kinase
MARFSVDSSAPAKAILFGEHAVVYGEPAIAVPVTQVEATAQIEPAPTGSGLTLIAADLGKSFNLAASPTDAPLIVAARLTLEHLSASIPDAILTVQSTIPIASGLGSGAAVSTALVRALAGYIGVSLSPAVVSDLVYEVERIHHGTPSGIDNTVIAYEQPVYFVRQENSKPELISVGAPFHLVIADSGLPSPTKRIVSRVRAARQRETARYDALFERIGDVVREARCRIEVGDVNGLGPLMDENHALLVDLGVSSPTLDTLVSAARGADALGTKLSGAGEGGNVLALVKAGTVDQVDVALRKAGATRTIRTTVTPGTLTSAP